MAEILSIKTVLPPHRYAQEHLSEILQSVWSKKHFNADRVGQFHQAVSVKERFLSLPLEMYQKELDFTERNEAFMRVASDLGQRAVEDALSAANVDPQEVDAIFFISTTGLAVPTVDAYLVNRLRMRRDIKRVPLFGLGCVAGAAGISRVHDYLQAYPDHIALLVSVELCSLTLQRDDLSVPNLISTGLFGDGAAAVVMAGERALIASKHKSQAQTIDNRSSFFYDTQKLMGWDIGCHGFKIVLSAEIPDLVRRHVRDDVDAFLQSYDLNRDDIDVWVSHPGGPKVITALEESLELPTFALNRTRQSLANLGNLSSASVLFVLQDTIEAGEFEDKDRKGVLMALGPGFCSELVLLGGAHS